VKTLNRVGMLGSVLLSGFKPMRLSQYRFHSEGIPFQKSIRITVHHGEFDEIETNFSWVVYGTNSIKKQMNLESSQRSK
jgi:hypothetical protein